MGLTSLLPDDFADSDLYGLLCPGRHQPGPSPVRVALAATPDAEGALPLGVDVPMAALYSLRVSGSGAGRWSADGRFVDIVDPSVLGLDVAGRLLPLRRGSHQLRAHLSESARLGTVELAPLRSLCIAPAEGWRGDQPLTFGDKARTMVQALGLRSRLPSRGEPLVIEAEHYAEATPTAVRTSRGLGAPASNESWVQAGDGPAELRFKVEVARPGLYSLLARVHGTERQVWSIDGAVTLRLTPDRGASSLGWSEVVTLPLRRGEHEISVHVAAGSGLDVIHLLERETEDADYLRVLESLGLQEGAPAELVTAGAARRNLESVAFDIYAAAAPGGSLALVEDELEDLFDRPLSPVLPGDL